MYFAPSNGVPLGIGYWCRGQNNRNDGATRWSKKFYDRFSRLETILACDRHPDIQTRCQSNSNWSTTTLRVSCQLYLPTKISMAVELVSCLPPWKSFKRKQLPISCQQALLTIRSLKLHMMLSNSTTSQSIVSIVILPHEEFAALLHCPWLAIKACNMKAYINWYHVRE